MRALLHGWTVATVAVVAAAALSATQPRTAAADVPTAPANTVAPVISGTPTVGETLTTDDGTWTGTPPIAYTYSWRRCDSTALVCKSITGATAPGYTLGPADVGSRIRVRVYAT